MYVRWQSRKRRRPAFGYGKGDVHWSAVLVENVRVDGKPTQRHIAYLVGFTESQVAIPAQRRFIWNTARACLNRLSNRVSPPEREAIEAVLIRKIGKPPTKQERCELELRRRAALGDDWCDEHPVVDL